MRISVLAIVNPPPLPVMPGAFNFRRQMYFDGLGGTGYALGPVNSGTGRRKKRLVAVLGKIAQQRAP